MSDATTPAQDTTTPGATQETTDEPKQTAAGSGDKGLPNADDASKGGDKTPADEAPFEAKLPDGVDIDQDGLKAFTDIVNDKALKPAEKSQRILDLAVKREQDAAQRFADTVKGWGDQIAADKELGNAENQAVARKLIEDFGTPELKGLLESSGMGNHPEIVRFVIKVGKALSEDAVHRARGDAPAGAQRDPASVLYDKSTPKA